MKASKTTIRFTYDTEIQRVIAHIRTVDLITNAVTALETQPKESTFAPRRYFT